MNYGLLYEIVFDVTKKEKEYGFYAASKQMVNCVCHDRDYDLAVWMDDAQRLILGPAFLGSVELNLQFEKKQPLVYWLRSLSNCPCFDLAVQGGLTRSVFSANDSDLQQQSLVAGG